MKWLDELAEVVESFVEGLSDLVDMGGSEMNSVTVNGKRINVQGNNISVCNGRVMVDGKVIEEGLQGIVKLQIEGDLADLNADCSVELTGSVHGNVDAGNSVKCGGDIKGNVDAGNSVKCGNIGGSVRAGNSVVRSDA